MEVPNLNRMIEEADHKITHNTPLTDLESFGEFDSSDDHSNPVERKLDISRRDLLDLSMWNKLLNYRALKTKGLEIIDELPDEIFRILVSDKRGMTFLHSPEQEVEDEEKDYLFSTLNDEEIKEFSQPDGENGLANRHTDNKLQTSYNSPILQKRLLSTYYTARTYIEEQGVNILYLALGMLNWYESDNSDEPRKAPLVLIPVDLSRSDVKAKFRLRFSEEEIGENLSLRSKMLSEFALVLPDFPDEEELEVSKYFESVRNSISSYDRWEVDDKAIALAFFSFGKFLMFNDLDSETWPEHLKPEENAILRGLLHDGFDREINDRIDERDISIDGIVQPQDIFHVVDADSSQSIAIYDANQGHNLVIQGPPGTGKSQTITNLVAEAIGSHKTVLFVSEKMAALEVVKRRLDQVGLGDACLELHSHKTKKKVVLDEIKRSLNLGQPINTEQVDLNELIRHQLKLNGYSKAVNLEIGESRLTPHEVYGKLIQIKEILLNKELPDLVVDSIDQWDYSRIQKSVAKIEEYQFFISRIGLPGNHPFWGCEIQPILPTTLENINSVLIKTDSSFQELIHIAGLLASLCSLSPPESLSEVQSLISNLEYLLSMPDLDDITIDDEAWVNEASLITDSIDQGEEILELRSKFEDVIEEASWDENVVDLLSTMQSYKSNWLRVFSRDYRSVKESIANLLKDTKKMTFDDLLVSVKTISDYQTRNKIFSQFEPYGKSLFGIHWKGYKSDWVFLKDGVAWINGFYKRISEDTLIPELVKFAKTNPDLGELENNLKNARKNVDHYVKNVQATIQALKLNQTIRFGDNLTFMELSLPDQIDILSSWLTNLARLQETVILRNLQQDLVELGLDLIVVISINWTYSGDHLSDLFNHYWLSMLLQRVMVERSVLNSFDSEMHELSMRKFSELDTKLLKRNQIRLAYEHWKGLPRHQAGGQLGVLRQEFAKKRRHLPIRKLLSGAGEVIQIIKPVFMMSPLSIAKYLTPGGINFELVIFDEASQVKPVDAFGAIIRGKQLIVVGDDRQLPPTTFFESAIDVDEDYSETRTMDLESILGLCTAQNLPQRMLRWHYRSQHESLITVSNFEFYDEKLVVFPSPDHEKQSVGLVYRYLPDTAYGRGKSRSNVGEAKAVAEAVINHTRKYPNLTLGVAAFSVSQMDTIRDQVEILRRQKPESESFFRAHPNEPFFVKNLENVQGDERDVIFISVGYGRTEDGKIGMNFGPLNKQGGERRLNVLITRARKRCEIFTNITSDDIDLRRTQSRGVQVLKKYLKYAQSGQLDIPMASDREADSPFEIAVAKKLRERGYDITHQIGTGGYFIDLAVVDNQKPGRYLLGIECDGAMYHSARSARDRDRLRQEVLENLGWQIHRIWKGIRESCFPD